MADLESTEEFARRMVEAVEDDHLLSREALPLFIAGELEADRAAIALRVLTELQFAFAGDLMDLDVTKADDIACAFRNAHARLVTKYTAAEPAVETREG